TTHTTERKVLWYGLLLPGASVAAAGPGIPLSKSATAPRATAQGETRQDIKGFVIVRPGCATVAARVIFIVTHPGGGSRTFYTASPADPSSQKPANAFQSARGHGHWRRNHPSDRPPTRSNRRTDAWFRPRTRRL